MHPGYMHQNMGIYQRFSKTSTFVLSPWATTGQVAQDYNRTSAAGARLGGLLGLGSAWLGSAASFALGSARLGSARRALGYVSVSRLDIINC